MSQLSPRYSLLKEIHSWSDEKCKNEFETAVPQLLEKITKSNPVELTEVCAALVEKFLWCSIHDDLGRKILDSISLELCKAFDELLSKLPGPSNDSSKMTVNAILPVLETAINILQCFDNVVRQLASLIKKTVTTIELSDVSQVSNSTIWVLKKSYSHCKSSEKDYGKVFKHASKALGLLFQKTYGLQKSLGFVIGSIKQSPNIAASNETKDLVKSICEGLFSICETTCTVDNTLLATTWKILLGFMKEFQHIVKSEIKPAKYLSLLTNNILQSLKYMFQLYDQSSHLVSCGDESTKKALAQSSKFVKYFWTFFSEIIKIFEDSLDEEIVIAVLRSLAEFHACFELSELPHDSNDEGVKFRMGRLSSFVEHETIAFTLFGSKRFLHCFALLKMDTHSYGWLQVWLCLSEFLLKNQKVFMSWCEKSDDREIPLVMVILRMIECAACIGDAINFTRSPLYDRHSLYDTIVAYVCALISQLPQTVFGMAEEKLFQCVISDDPVKSVIACDVISFLVKSSRSLLERYKTIIISILQTVAEGVQVSIPLQTLILLLSRMGFSTLEVIKMLSSKQSGLPLWSTMLSSDIFDEASTTSMDVCQEIILKCQNKVFCLEDILQLTGQLRNILMFLLNPKVVKKYQATLKTCCSSLITTLLDSEPRYPELSKSVIFSNFSTAVLSTLMGFLAIADAHEKSQVIQYLLLFMQSELSVIYKLAIIEVLAHMNELSSNNIQGLSIAFQTFIRDPNQRVCNAALKSFSHLSQTQSSMGTSLLEKCASDRNVAEIIEKYFSFECNSTFHIVEKKKLPTSATQIRKWYKSWSSKLSEKSLTFLNNAKSLPNSCADDIMKQLSVIRESVTSLNQFCLENKSELKGLDACTLQNLTDTKSAFDSLLKQFDL